MTAPTAHANRRASFCKPFDGTAAQFQEYAARVLVEHTESIRFLPWTWFGNTCGTAQCLFSAHIQVNNPIRIAYPKFVCVYCGRVAGTKDHLMPLHFTGIARRRYVAVVPACVQCNSAINDLPEYNITARRRRAHAYLAKRYRKYLDPPCPLDGLEGNLRKHVQQASKNKELIEALLAWPDDPDYDLRAFQASGIEDPYLLELI